MRLLSIYIIIVLCLFSCAHNDEKAFNSIAKNGVFEVNQTIFNKVEKVPLNGEWAFYINKFLCDSTIKKRNLKPDTLLKVPGLWNEVFKNNSNSSGYGHGTYTLKIKGLKSGEIYGLQFRTIGTASKIYADNKLIGETGIIGENKSISIPHYKPQVCEFKATSSEANLNIQVSNFNHRKGGLWLEILFGRKENIHKSQLIHYILEGILLGAILLMSLYHFGLFIIRPKDHSALFFGIFAFLMAWRIGFTGEFLSNLFWNISWVWQVRFDYMAFFLTVSTFTTFIYVLFKEVFNKYIYYFLTAIPIIATLIALFTNNYILTKVVWPMQIFTLIGASFIAYVLIRAAIKGLDGAKTLLTGFFLFLITIINDVLANNEILSTPPNLFVIGILLFVLSQAYTLAHRFSKSFRRTEELSTELNYTNKNLEKLVNERTESLQLANDELTEKHEEIVQQREEILTQNDELTEQNAIIEKAHKDITSSLNYAKTIQQSLLTHKDMIDQWFKEYFILYLPKDQVSGDFYYVNKVGENVVFTVADCTGHGVPGGFITILGITYIHEIVKNSQIHEANKVLDALRTRVKASFQKFGSGNLNGMDLAYCIIDTKTNVLQYAGAYNPLYIYRENKLIEYTATKTPIGHFPKQVEFVNNEIQLQNDDIIYIFSDGYEDQFGGKKKKKFMRRRFKQLLLDIHKLPLDEQEIILLEKLNEWKGDLPQIDDITVMAVKWKIK